MIKSKSKENLNILDGHVIHSFGELPNFVLAKGQSFRPKWQLCGQVSDKNGNAARKRHLHVNNTCITQVLYSLAGSRGATLGRQLNLLLETLAIKCAS